MRSDGVFARSLGVNKNSPKFGKLWEGDELELLSHAVRAIEQGASIYSQIILLAYGTCRTYDSAMSAIYRARQKKK